jgi:hypothetical protein
MGRPARAGDEPGWHYGGFAGIGWAAGHGNYAGQYGGGTDNAILPSVPGFGSLPATATLTRGAVAANQAGPDGGGIYHLRGGSVTLTSTAVTGNRPATARRPAWFRAAMTEPPTPLPS